MSELIELLRKARLVVSNDIGPGHIAAALDTPLVMMYSWSNPARIAPYRRPECMVARDPYDRGPGIRSQDPKHLVTNITIEKAYATVCDQLGACVDVCPVKALSRNKKGVVLRSKKLCVGCYACVGFCPRLAMFTHPDLTEPFKCVACGECVDECPEGVLSIVEVPDLEPSETEKWGKVKGVVA